MNGVIASIVVIVMSALILFALRDDGSMQECMKVYSEATCYHTLAR
jgi:hypothetical protein